MKNMNKSDIDLVKLLKQFDLATKSFKFSTKSFKIIANVVIEILGLPNEGKYVKLDNERYTSTFRTRHFGGNSKPSKDLVEEELHKAITLANKPKQEKANTKQKKLKNKNKRKRKRKRRLLTTTRMWSA